VKAALYDSSIYVAALRSGDDGVLSIRRLDTGSVVWLSAVVLEELYAGVNDRGLHVVERLERDFDRAKRVLVPTVNDWAETGWVLSRLVAKYDYEHIGRGRLTNDALIAMSASRLGICVMTANERDFRRLAEFRSFQWQVTAV
jgi:predicted nucleic acid-binding protein